MFPTRTGLLILGALVLFSPSLSAGTSVWAEGYPQRNKSGDILVKGTATADGCGFTLTTGTGKGLAVAWPAGENGGTIISANIDVATDCSGNWSGTITGLDPKVSYVVVVQIMETAACCKSGTINTQPRTARAQENGDDDDDDDD
jgi:hypothetical protein